MSGISTGTRLEQLERLKAKVDLEIAAERRRLALDERFVTFQRADHDRRRVDATKARLEQLGVTAKDVKVWAVGVGLLADVKRGRVARELVEKYAEARP